MLNKSALHNLRVLITRPQHQAKALSAKLTQHGAICFLYPVLTIELTKQVSNFISQLKQQDYLIFTSVNAVLSIQTVLQQLHQNHQLPKLITVGATTAQSLMDLGLPKPDYPTDFSSEGILQLDCLQSCEEQRIGLLSGVGGRTLLLDQLTHRGAKIQKFEVYRRIPVQKPTKSELLTWQNPGIDVVISTSAEGLVQLVSRFEALDYQAKTWLLAKQLLVMSERLVPIAKTLHFSKIPLVAKTQSDDGIVETLITAQMNKGNDNVRNR